MKEPIIYNAEQPLAHYERAGKLKKKVDTTLKRGLIIPVVAFIIGSLCVAFDPALMAVMALFGLMFCLLAFIGCWARRPKLCLFSIPLGLVAALTAELSGSDLAHIGAIAFLAASGLQIFVINASAEFRKLKELPGFPFFDPALDDITFAAKDRLGSDQYIDSSEMHAERPERIRYVPVGEPSDEMDELLTEDVEIPEVVREEKAPPAKVWDEAPKSKESRISDDELFE